MLLEMVTLNQSLADCNLKLQQKRQKETLEALGSQVPEPTPLGFGTLPFLITQLCGLLTEIVL